MKEEGTIPYGRLIQNLEYLSFLLLNHHALSSSFDLLIIDNDNRLISSKLPKKSF